MARASKNKSFKNTFSLLNTLPACSFAYAWVFVVLVAVGLAVVAGPVVVVDAAVVGEFVVAVVAVELDALVRSDLALHFWFSLDVLRPCHVHDLRS